MGLGWFIVAIFLPGIPQLLHLDLMKVLIIWFLPGVIGLSTAGIASLSGISVIASGPLGLGASIFVGLYNLYTALKY
jgi:hypothetical protein